MMNVNAYQSNALAYGWFSINMQYFIDSMTCTQSYKEISSMDLRYSENQALRLMSQ